MSTFLSFLPLIMVTIAIGFAGYLIIRHDFFEDDEETTAKHAK